jgi:gamma-glutamylcyclotransferase (GGCT)/AIG2-like uncharacterized protein YtfP
MEPVFVYGSLRKGMHNHRVMGSSKLLAEATLTGFDMYQVSSFPAIVVGEGGVKGEIYLVDNATLARLDRLEGHPRMYRREVVTVQSGSCLFDVWVYVWQGPVDYLAPVPSGDWVEYYEAYSSRPRLFVLSEEDYAA